MWCRQMKKKLFKCVCFSFFLHLKLPSHWITVILHISEVVACVISCMMYRLSMCACVSGEHIGLPPHGPLFAISWSPWKDGVVQGQRSTVSPRHPLAVSMYYHTLTLNVYMRAQLHSVYECVFTLFPNIAAIYGISVHF